MCSVWCLQNIASSLMAKKLSVCLIRPKKPSSSWPWSLPHVFGWPLDDLMSFLHQWLSLCHSPMKLWLVKNQGNSCCVSPVSPISPAEDVNSFRVAIGVLVASLTSLLLAQSLSLWGRSALGRFTQICAVFLLLLNDGFRWTPGDVQRLGDVFCIHPLNYTLKRVNTYKITYFTSYIFNELTLLCTSVFTLTLKIFLFLCIVFVC